METCTAAAQETKSVRISKKKALEKSLFRLNVQISTTDHLRCDLSRSGSDNSCQISHAYRLPINNKQRRQNSAASLFVLYLLLQLYNCITARYLRKMCQQRAITCSWYCMSTVTLVGLMATVLVRVCFLQIRTGSSVITKMTVRHR